jgi:hypothetical protein
MSTATATATPSGANLRPLRPLPAPPSRPYTILQSTTPSKVTKPRSTGTSSEKKEARKLAHSDIERKRRLKINHQFDQLKALVPACTQFKAASGGDSGLHKLEILQHTVRYIEHLHTCLQLSRRGSSEDDSDDSQRRMSIASLLS